MKGIPLELLSVDKLISELDAARVDVDTLKNWGDTRILKAVHKPEPMSIYVESLPAPLHYLLKDGLDYVKKLSFSRGHGMIPMGEVKVMRKRSQSGILFERLYITIPRHVVFDNGWQPGDVRVDVKDTAWTFEGPKYSRHDYVKQAGVWVPTKRKTLPEQWFLRWE